MNDKVQILADSILFKGLTESLLHQVAAVIQEKRFRRGASIFFEGDKATGFYMVGHGRVKIFKLSLTGREQILHIFGPGEPFGEVPVFNDHPFPANAVSMEASRLLFFPRRVFADLLTAIPSLALSMLGILSLRLRCFAAQVESLSLHEAPQRLADHLRYLAEEQGRTDRVVLDIPKGQLANLLGTSPETLSRIFAKMTKEGLIRVQGREVDLLRYADLHT